MIKTRAYAHALRTHNIPVLFATFQAHYKKNNQEMKDMLLKHGVIGITYATYNRWKSDSQAPRGLSVLAIEAALESAAKELDEKTS